MNDVPVAKEILALEQAALERWGHGDPGGLLDLSAADVTYYDPFIDHRIDGIQALADYYDGIQHHISIDRFEIVNPKVTHAGDLAVLVFNFVSMSGKYEFRWNCSEMYRRLNSKWKIIHSHWSFTNPHETPEG